MKSKRKASMNGRSTQKLDLTKPVKVSAAGGLRTKGDVYGTIAEKVGINRRDVAGAVSYTHLTLPTILRV